MRFHWLAVALKFVLVAVVVKILLVLVVLLTLPLLAVDYHIATRYWPSLFRRARA
jgi:hypothetical protein